SPALCLYLQALCWGSDCSGVCGERKSSSGDVLPALRHRRARKCNAGPAGIPWTKGVAMETMNRVSRRRFLVTGSGLTLASILHGAVADKEHLPVIAKRVEKAFKAPCKAPNDLEAMSDGLWILDQVDPNKAFKVKYEDGSVISQIQTESIHGSGICFGNGALWVASTWDLKTLKVDPQTGKTLAAFDTPGAGMN